MAKIFISYKREDLEKVRPLAESLEKQGWSVWWDPKLRGGQPFSEIIEKALSEARCVIVVWSNKSINSNWVAAEAMKGHNRKILVAVNIENNIEVPVPFNIIHSIPLINWSGTIQSPQFEKIVEDLEELLGLSPLKVKEAERKRAEAEEAERKRAEAEEAERKRAEAKEAKRKRAEAKEAERKRAEAKEAERKRAEAKEAKRKRAEAEEAERKRAEAKEAKRKRAEAEEAERKRAEAEEAERKRAEAKEAKRKRAEAKEAERKRAEAKEAERKRAEAKEAKRKRAEAEEAERKRAEAKEAKRKRAEAKEAERKRAEAKEAERKRAEEESFDSESDDDDLLSVLEFADLLDEPVAEVEQADELDLSDLELELELPDVELDEPIAEVEQADELDLSDLETDEVKAEQTTNQINRNWLLSWWNPFGYLRLLWWVPFRRSVFIKYRDGLILNDKKRLKRQTRWIANNLVWWPVLLWLCWPYLDNFQAFELLSSNFYIWSASIIVAWFLTGLFGSIDNGDFAFITLLLGMCGIGFLVIYFGVKEVNKLLWIILAALFLSHIFTCSVTDRDVDEDQISTFFSSTGALAFGVAIGITVGLVYNLIYYAWKSSWVGISLGILSALGTLLLAAFISFGFSVIASEIYPSSK